MSRLIVDFETLEAKAQASLTIVCARVGIDTSTLTKLERALWMGAYREAYLQGARDHIADELDQLGAKP